MLMFLCSYIWVAIGFMMMFIILFSWQPSLNIKRFPGALVSILVMMLGEINYTDLQFPTDQVLNKTTGYILEEDVYPQFPVTAHFTLILFILMFCLVTMNLLVGIAVSDISQLVKTSKRDQLMAQVELANAVGNICKMNMFKYFPERLQNIFKRSS